MEVPKNSVIVGDGVSGHTGVIPDSVPVTDNSSFVKKEEDGVTVDTSDADQDGTLNRLEVRLVLLFQHSTPLIS